MRKSWVSLGKLSLDMVEDDLKISYSVMEGETVRTSGFINKQYPGWSTVWRETFNNLVAVMGELEEGTGLQSRAFQQSSSTGARLYHAMINK